MRSPVSVPSPATTRAVFPPPSVPCYPRWPNSKTASHERCQRCQIRFKRQPAGHLFLHRLDPNIAWHRMCMSKYSQPWHIPRIQHPRVSCRLLAGNSAGGRAPGSCHACPERKREQGLQQRLVCWKIDTTCNSSSFPEQRRSNTFVSKVLACTSHQGLLPLSGLDGEILVDIIHEKPLCGATCRKYYLY